MIQFRHGDRPLGVGHLAVRYDEDTSEVFIGDEPPVDGGQFVEETKLLLQRIEASRRRKGFTQTAAAGGEWVGLRLDESEVQRMQRRLCLENLLNCYDDEQQAAIKAALEGVIP